MAKIEPGLDGDQFGGARLRWDESGARSSGLLGDWVQTEGADDRLIYNSANGKLFYDADGSGAGDVVLIARLGGAAALDASDFLVV